MADIVFRKEFGTPPLVEIIATYNGRIFPFDIFFIKKKKNTKYNREIGKNLRWKDVI